MNNINESEKEALKTIAQYAKDLKDFCDNFMKNSWGVDHIIIVAFMDIAEQVKRNLFERFGNEPMPGVEALRIVAKCCVTVGDKIMNEIIDEHVETNE